MTNTKIFPSITRIKLHPQGSVEYVDHMGSDTDIVAAARVSYGKEGSKGESEDRRLLEYLFRNKHTSPFEMAKIKFRIVMPIFVARQYVRHRMQNLNEVSGRYTELEDKFFSPLEWRGQDTKNRQGSSGVLSQADQDTADGLLEASYNHSYKTYQALLDLGVARELARIVLPLGLYTSVIACWDLNNLIKFWRLRDDSHAQSEIRDVSNAMKEIAAQCFPATVNLYIQSITPNAR